MCKKILTASRMGKKATSSKAVESKKKKAEKNKEIQLVWQDRPDIPAKSGMCLEKIRAERSGHPDVGGSQSSPRSRLHQLEGCLWQPLANRELHPWNGNLHAFCWAWFSFAHIVLLPRVVGVLQVGISPPQPQLDSAHSNFRASLWSFSQNPAALTAVLEDLQSEAPA